MKDKFKKRLKWIFYGILAFVVTIYGLLLIFPDLK